MSFKRSKAKKWQERIQVKKLRKPPKVKNRYDTAEVTKVLSDQVHVTPKPLDRKEARALKAWINAYKKSKGCIQSCGETHPAALSFHHRIRSQKVFCIGESHKLGKTQEEVAVEIDKCDVICHNCHAKLHWAESHTPTEL